MGGRKDGGGCSRQGRRGGEEEEGEGCGKGREGGKKVPGAACMHRWNIGWSTHGGHMEVEKKGRKKNEATLDYVDTMRLL